MKVAFEKKTKWQKSNQNWKLNFFPCLPQLIIENNEIQTTIITQIQRHYHDDH